MARNSARPGRASPPPVDILDRLLNLTALWKNKSDQADIQILLLHYGTPCRYSRSIVESPVSLAILKIRIYVADYVLSKVCDLTHQFEFK